MLFAVRITPTVPLPFNSLKFGLCLSHLNAFNISRHPLIPKPLNQTMVKTNEGYKEFPTKIVEDSLAVLKSLDLVTDVTISEEVFLGNSGIVRQEALHLTPLGILFIDACVKDASK